ncbi:DUF4956 domain-containing protein [Chloroflexota bacterium]
MPSFEEFFAGQAVQISAWELIANLAIAAVLSFILSYVYVHYGNSLSNRRMFARDFVILIMTTALIITVVKSSLALSLGLVGALSIVRFRAAIKEPEELAYLFISIAVGLGLGANQGFITTIAFLVIMAVVVLRKKFFHKKHKEDQNLHLTISSHNPDKIGLEKILQILTSHCSSVNLRRFDETDEILEASFLVDFSNFGQMEKVRDELTQLSRSMKITFLDSRGMY